jgi:hypothetical protein
MGPVMEVVNPNTSTDIIAINYVERIPYGDWIRKLQAEYREKSGPVTTRVVKAECERIMQEFKLKTLTTTANSCKRFLKGLLYIKIISPKILSKYSKEVN